MKGTLRYDKDLGWLVHGHFEGVYQIDPENENLLINKGWIPKTATPDVSYTLREHKKLTGIVKYANIDIWQRDRRKEL